MKREFFKHLCNAVAGAACAAVLIGSSLPAIPGQEADAEPKLGFQETFSQETEGNEPGISPQNDMDDTKYHKN